MCNSNHPNFLAGFVQTMCYEKDKAVHCDLCELWVNIKCNNLSNIQITGIFKTAMNPCIAQDVAVQFFFSTPFLVKKQQLLGLFYEH